MFPGSPLRKLKRASAPAPAYRDALRSQLSGSASRAPRIVLRSAMAFAGMVLLAVFGLGSYAYASPAIAEGSTLYNMKLSLERIEANFHTSEQAAVKFRSKILRRRVREAVYRHEHGAATEQRDYSPIANELDATADALEVEKIDPALRTELRTEVRAAIEAFKIRVSTDPTDDEQQKQVLERIDLRLNGLSP